uniref:RNase H type-1 domain-containing protein n=1 Tax=Tanacetum cinerariifolium TaxID=118510 RepID=A0A6L2LSD4_TANCI|nr:hypothetical protein [Tanacetum cinerariifolium]
MDTRSSSTTLRNEETCGDFAKAHNTNTWGSYNDVSRSFDRKHKHSLIREKGRRIGYHLLYPKGKEYTFSLRFKFETTNDKAEYEALLAGLRIAQEMEIVNLAIFIDTQLLVETKDEESWMTPIHEYLLSSLLPKVPKESKKIRIKEPQYKLIRGSLYKKSFYTPWLCCLAPPKTDDVIKEIHEGSCGFNTEPLSMVVRITKQGYYWPSMHRDVARIIQNYEKWKEQYTVRKRTKIRAIADGNVRPFSHWGVSILGPLPTAPGGLKFLAIAIEHSTK